MYADTKKECEKKLNEYIRMVETGTYLEPTKITVADYLKHWLKIHSPNLAPNTAEGYKCTIEKHIIPVIGSLQLAKLTPIHLQSFYADEQKKFSGKTALLTHRILRKALTMAVRTQLISQNPADLVDAPRAKKFKPKVYDEEQYASLLKAIEGTMHELPVLLAGGLGMRRGEIFGLRWQDVDFKEGVITVEQQLIPNSQGLLFKQPKTEDSVRTIDVPEFILELLRKAKKEQQKNKMFYGPDFQDNDLVCCQENGEPIHPSTYSNMFCRLLKKHKLGHIRFHDLRHFNATIMLKYNVPIKVASKRLGHSTTAITQDIYQHVLTDMDKEAARKINDVLFQNVHSK